MLVNELDFINILTIYLIFKINIIVNLIYEIHVVRYYLRVQTRFSKIVLVAY